MGYKNIKEVAPLCVLLPKVSEYVKNFDFAKITCFLIKDEKLLMKYCTMKQDWKNFEKKKFHSAPVFNDKYLKIEIRSYNKKITTNFHGKAPKEGLVFLCLSAIAIDSVFK